MTKVRSVAAPVRNSPPATTEALQSYLRRVEGEYLEMPGLSVTPAQAERLWGLSSATCALVLTALVQARTLKQTARGTYILDR